ncbi:MAG: glycosyltransferase [Pseudonocardiaceae bacterium]
MLNVPFRLPSDPSRWITVPPQGYGGIQWVVANLVDGLVELGCSVALLGAPGTAVRERLDVVPVVDQGGVQRWLEARDVDIAHDHSNGAMVVPDRAGVPVISTFHLTGAPRHPANCVYVSHAQRRMAGSARAPVVRLPVNPDRYVFRAAKRDYLLFLGRVSAHKGVWEAARFAAAAGLPLRVAGPAWEADYLAALLADYPSTVEYLGEVGGQARLDLLADARAVLVMSQPVAGPFGTEWVEPGATVVSEVAVCGTPTIATDNGCLSEIVPGVGTIVPGRTPPSARMAAQVLESLPDAQTVRDLAVRRWSHVTIASRYLELYRWAARGGWT